MYDVFKIAKRLENNACLNETLRTLLKPLHKTTKNESDTSFISCSLRVERSVYLLILCHRIKDSPQHINKVIWHVRLFCLRLRFVPSLDVTDIKVYHNLSRKLLLQLKCSA